MASAKKLIKGLVITTVALIGMSAAAVGIYQNVILKGQIEKTIADVNTKLSTGPLIMNLSYKELQVSGSVINSTVRLIDPVIDMTLTMPPSKVVTPAASTATPVAATQLPATTPPPLHSRVAFVGSLEIKTDYLQHQYEAVLKGNQTAEITSIESTTLTAQNIEQRASLRTDSLSHFLQWQFNMTDNISAKQALLQIAQLDVSSTPVEFTDAASKTVAMRVDASKLSLTNRSTDNQLDVDFAINVSGMEIFPAYARIVNSYMVQSNPLYANAGIPADQIPFSMERAGRQDIDIAGSVNIPLNASAKAGVKCMPASVQLSKYNFRSNFSEFTMPISFNMAPENGVCNFAFNQQLDFTFKPAATQETALLVNIIPSILSTNGLASTTAKQPDPQLLKQKITEALPNLSTTSPIHFGVKLSGKFPLPPEGQTSAPAPGTFTIDQINLTNSRWGIETNGAFDKASKKLDGKLVCRKCDMLTYDIMATVIQINNLMQLYGDKPSPLPLGAPMLTDINALLAEIGSKDATTGDVTLALTTPAPNDVRINDKPMGQVMMLAMQRAQPYMLLIQQSRAAAAAPATTPTTAAKPKPTQTR